jgi:hypothetical protein
MAIDKNKIMCVVEGKHDLFFIEYILKKYCKTEKSQIKNFNNSVPKNKQKNKETTEIRNFIEPSSPYHVLIKSENGKKGIISLLSDVIVSFAMKNNSNNKLYIVMDSDHQDIKSLTNEIKQTLSSQRQLTTTCKDIKIKNSNSLCKQFYLVNCEVSFHNEKRNANIKLIVVNPSLEIICDIEENDDESSLNKKIDEYCESNKENISGILDQLTQVSANCQQTIRSFSTIQ